MAQQDAVDDPLRGWDPRRRAALQRLWDRFAAGDTRRDLTAELLAERRREAAAEDDEFDHR